MKSFVSRDGKFNKVSDNGRVVVYQNGGVLFQPSGTPHSKYTTRVGSIGSIDPARNDLLSYLTKK